VTKFYAEIGSVGRPASSPLQGAHIALDVHGIQNDKNMTYTLQHTHLLIYTALAHNSFKTISGGL